MMMIKNLIQSETMFYLTYDSEVLLFRASGFSYMYMYIRNAQTSNPHFENLEL